MNLFIVITYVKQELLLRNQLLKSVPLPSIMVSCFGTPFYSCLLEDKKHINHEKALLMTIRVVANS